MPIRNRPIRPDLLLKGEEDSLRKPSLAFLKKFNYTYLYADNGLDTANFSFFGDPRSEFDYSGLSSNLFYGRIDSQGDAISPNLQTIDSISAGNSTKFALNFVAQAFNQFRARFTSERSGANVLKIRSSNYRGLLPAKAFENPDTLHSNLLETVFEESALPFLMQAKYNTHIASFHDFMNVFLGEFVPDIMLEKLKIPLTRSNFVLCNKSTPLTSGLVIEVAEADYNNDLQKFEDWISSKAYPVIRDGAANHGFIIDKHAPWRFVANLNSPRMLKFIQGKGLNADKDQVARLNLDGDPMTVENVFQLYYNKVYFRDVEILKLTLLNFYNNYVSLKRNVSYPAMQKCARPYSEIEAPSLLVRTRTREKYSMEKLNSEYPTEFWLNQYLILRLLEGGTRLNDERLYRQFKKISHINKYLSQTQALTYINEYAKYYTGFNSPGTSEIESFEKLAFDKTANPQILGIAKSILPEDELIEEGQ